MSSKVKKRLKTVQRMKLTNGFVVGFYKLYKV